jgi:hypothetical protein
MLLSSAIGFRVRKSLGTYLFVVYLTFIILQDRILVCLSVCVCVYFSMTQQPNSVLGHLVLEASRSYQLDTPPGGLL